MVSEVIHSLLEKPLYSGWIVCATCYVTNDHLTQKVLLSWQTIVKFLADENTILLLFINHYFFDKFCAVFPLVQIFRYNFVNNAFRKPHFRSNESDVQTSIFVESSFEPHDIVVCPWRCRTPRSLLIFNTFSSVLVSLLPPLNLYLWKNILLISINNHFHRLWAGFPELRTNFHCITLLKRTLPCDNVTKYVRTSTKKYFPKTGR